MLYRVAEDQGDYDLCKELADSAGYDASEIIFPTVMVFDDEDLIGFIGTLPKPDMILAGPLVMKPDRIRPFALMKLVSAYDQVMANLNVKSYVFSTKKDSGFNRGIEHFLDHMDPYAQEGDELFYVRNIEYGQ